MDNFIGASLRALESIGVFVGSEGVYLNELQENPTLLIEGDFLTIETAHSLRNSAKEIYKLKLEYKDRKVLIQAFQKLVSSKHIDKYRQQFLIPEQFRELSINIIEFYWIDPDGKQHQLQSTPS